jgi:hypothetical protein
MKTLKTLVPCVVASVIALGTGCASRPHGSTMVLSAPTLIDASVAADLCHRDDEATIGFLLAAASSNENPIEAADAWLAFIEPRLAQFDGSTGLERLSDECNTVRLLSTQIVNDSSIRHDQRIEYLARLDAMKSRFNQAADRIADNAIGAASRIADEGDLWWMNDRAKIHDALVELAPFAKKSAPISSHKAGDIAKTRAYVLSYVSETEHRQLLIDSGHVE